MYFPFRLDGTKMYFFSVSHFPLQVIDRSGGELGEFTDVTKVEKFVLSEDAYEKRSGK